MVDVRPFRGVHYDPAVVGDLTATTAPAFDDIDRFAYAHRRTASPYTVLELLAAHPDRGYAPARDVLRRWWRTGVLTRDRTPAIYRYEEHELREGAPAVQRGLCVCMAVTGFTPDGPVLPHEETDTERLEERAARLDAVPLDVSPVFALYRQGPSVVREVLDAVPTEPPIVAITDEDGTDHRVWRVDAPEQVHELRDALRHVQVVIADGHHRYATALARARKHAPDAASPVGHTLAYLVDADVHGPRVLAVHRLLRRAPHDLLARVEADFTIHQVPDDPEQLARTISGSTERRWGLHLATPGGPGTFLLRPRDDAALIPRAPAGHSSRWRQLDTAVLHHAVLANLPADTVDVETRSDTAAAIAEVDAGRAAALFLLRPTTSAEVLHLARQGEPMPAKTTSFRPKPRTGLIMRSAAAP